MNESGLLEWQQKFIQHLENQGKSPNTLKNYRIDLVAFNKFLVQKSKDVSLNGFNEQHAHEFGVFLDQIYPSSNSRRRRLQAVRIFFDYLVEQGGFTHNPLKKIEISPKFLDSPHPINFEDFYQVTQAILNEIEQCHDEQQSLDRLLHFRNLVIFYLIYASGLKVSDFEQLQMAHITHAKNSLRVLVIPRKRDPYSVPSLDLFTELIKIYKNELKRAYKQYGLETDHIIFNANSRRIIGGGLSARGIELIFKKYAKQFDLADFTAKNLRQACVIRWIAQGERDSLIKEWLGVAPSYELKGYLDYYQLKKKEIFYPTQWQIEIKAQK
jgi:site-specific recombinase XerD